MLQRDGLRWNFAPIGSCLKLCTLGDNILVLSCFFLLVGRSSGRGFCFYLTGGGGGGVGGFGVSHTLCTDEVIVAYNTCLIFVAHTAPICSLSDMLSWAKASQNCDRVMFFPGKRIW